MAKLSRTVPSLMRAIQVAEFGGPEVLKLRTDVPVPKLDKTQVLIKVHAAGINPVDTYIRAGSYSVVPPLPYTPGSDAAGIVEEVGEDVTTFNKGDRVYTSKVNSGSYAEYCVSNVDTTFHLHDNMDFKQGATLGIAYCTAYRAMFIRGKAKPGNTVLIHGASGGVGLACCQIGRAFGLKVIGTAGTAEGEELVTQSGAHHVFNHKQDTHAEDIMKLTNNQGVDIIVEMLANRNLQTDLGLLNRGGRVMVVGNRGRIEIDARLTMKNETSVMGVALMTSNEEEWKECGAVIQAGMEQKWINPVIGKVYTMDEVPKAHVDIIENTGAKGKLIISM